jgi:hypothetical protein
MSIDLFKSRLKGGGARANQFRVSLNPPATVGYSPEETSFMVKAAALPGQAITEIPINFRGRQLFVAGDRTFETWTTTILNDTDFKVRNNMEAWMSSINDLETSVGVSDLSLYTSDILIQQLDRDNSVLKSYTLKTCWPTAIAAIDLNMDTVSEIETFDVTWRYTSFSASSV